MSFEEEEKKIYTLSDIARELGVNKATVSKAISGKGSLRPETRARILECIERHNYRPNAAAQSLARSKTDTIGLMMPSDTSAFDETFFQDCLRGVCAAASAGGYDVLITMDCERTVAHIARLIDRRKVDGVIAMRNLVNSPMAGFLKEKRMPFVLIGPTSDPEITSVDNDNQSACRDMTALLAGRGIRRMALLGGDENNCVTHSRLAGFWDACGQCGLKREDQMVFLNVGRDNALSEAVDAAVRRKAECIVCMDDHICGMALVRLRSCGVRIPKDMKIVSFYDNALLEMNIPPVTSLRFDAEELGRLACRKLIDELEGRSGENTVLPGYRMLLRESTE